MDTSYIYTHVHKVIEGHVCQGNLKNQFGVYQQFRCKPVLYFNPFPDDKILDWSKLKAFADDKLSVTKMKISVFDRVESIVGKGEIAYTSNFSFFHNVFKRLLSQKRQTVSLCGNGLNLSSVLDSLPQEPRDL